jgi:hypothetical protein
MGGQAIPGIGRYSAWTDPEGRQVHPMGEHFKAEMLQRLLIKLAIKEQRRSPLPARMAVGLLAVRHHAQKRPAHPVEYPVADYQAKNMLRPGSGE